MNIIIEEINKLIPYHNNPRKNQAVDKVASSIKEFGWQQPIVVDESKVIVVGHTRYQAAQKLGLKEVPIHIAKGLTESQIKAYRLLDNRANQDALWDDEMLKIEIKGLEELDIDLKLTGFTDKELDNLLFEEKEGLTDEDKIPEPPKEPITNLGDIWELGNHKLMCGDSTLIENLEKLCLEKADMIFTDPPYGMSYGGGRAECSTEKGALVKAHGMIKNDDLRDEELIKLVKNSLQTALSKTKQGGSAYICFTWRTYSEFYKAITDAGFNIKNCLVWDKRSIGLGQSHYRPQHEFIFTAVNNGMAINLNQMFGR